MSPWTAFLESLHSAFIDELTDRHPEPKPELGLPLRQNRFGIPSPEIEQLLIVEVAFDNSHGIALLACQSGFAKGLGEPQRKLWEAMVNRAGSEFSRRGIRPKFFPVQEFRSADTFPPSTLNCSRVIWMPIRIPAGQCFFGVGV